MGLLSRIRGRSQRSGTQADASVEDARPLEEQIKTPYVMCPKCRHQWTRKPSHVEKLAGMAGHINVKELLYIYRPFCVFCQKKFQNIQMATIDHIQPKSRGGLDGLNNYQLLCKACNQRKSNKWQPQNNGPTIQLQHLVEVIDLAKDGPDTNNSPSNPPTGASGTAEETDR